MAAQPNIMVKLDIAKMLTALLAAGSFIFYAGKLDQKVSDMQVRLEKIENRLEVSRLAPSKPISKNTFTLAGHLEACLLNEEERL